MKFILIVALLVHLVNAETKYVSNDLLPLTDDMVEAINALNVTWKAGGNFKFNELINTQNEKYYGNFPNVMYSTAYFSLPKTFDARTKWSNCPSIGKIYDQRKGYPSWVYAAVGSVADRLCIKFGVQVDVESTVNRFMRSINFNSANIGQVFNYWSKNGIYTVGSKTNSNCSPFSTECQANEVEFRYYNVKITEPKFCNDKMVDIMNNGPLPLYLSVHSDFPSYKSGVYKINSKKVIGMHNVKLIGWGIENGINYWLGTNSWGSDWGENGLFKIHSCEEQFGTVTGIPSASFTQENRTIMEPLSQVQLFDLV